MLSKKKQEKSGSFIIIPSLRKSNNKWEIRPCFEISVPLKEISLLKTNPTLPGATWPERIIIELKKVQPELFSTTGRRSMGTIPVLEFIERLKRN